MRMYQLFLAITLLLSGMAFEQIGPDKDQPHPTVEQPGWPARMVGILKHDSRVYSIWVNGNENYYFKARPDEIGELIKLYSESRVRDHVVTIKQQKNEVRTFKEDKIDYNVNFHFLGGIALGLTRREGKAETYDPTLTIYVDVGADLAWSKQIVIPEHVIVNSEVAGWPVRSNPTKPNRRLWHAEVVFDDKKPAGDSENGASTKVTLWEKDAESGLPLGHVNHKGEFSAALSEKEIADLKAGKTWLTLTVGSQRTVAKKSDAQLDIGNMSPDRLKVKTVEVARRK